MSRDSSRRVTIGALAVGLAGSIGLGSWWTATSLEQELTSRAQNALGSKDLTANVVFDGADALIESSDSGKRDAALAAVQSVPGVRSVQWRDQAPASSPSPSRSTSPTASPTVKPSPKPSPSPKPKAAPKLSPVQFEGGTTDRLGGNKTLSAAIAYLKENPTAKVTITGHTDWGLTKKEREALGKERASVIARSFTRAGISKSRIVVRSAGSRKPIASNKTKAGQAKNRRVEITIVTKESS